MGTRAWARVAGAAAAVLAVGGGAAPAGAADAVLVLPAPVTTIPVPAAAFPDRPERLRQSSVPGPLTDTEDVEVRLGPDGTPAGIAMTQRLELSGTGDFVIRERATAISVTALEDTPAPVLQRGAVVWQGFVPGRRLLAARIELDPVVEAPRLPLGVGLSWTPAGSGTAPGPGGTGSGPGGIGAGGALDGDGRLVVRLANQSRRPDTLPTGDAAAADLAGPLDAALRHAVSGSTGAPGSTGPPPMAGRGLPRRLVAHDVGARAAVSYAPLRIAGTIRVAGGAGATATGPGTSPLPEGDGARVAGVLAESAEIALDVRGGGRLVLDLTAVPALDPRTLQPPSGGSWSAWAATAPDETARRAAVDALVGAASAAARSDEYAPYFGHHGPGPVRTTFRYAVAPAVAVAPGRPPLRPRPVPIALALAGVAAAGSGAVAVWRRL